MSADDRDDDLEGDEQLKSLRSVWVSMRESDEDPPDRGLSALMAAAREKASVLAEPPRESWWQKVLATLRRPPVLALASVMVLLGGALFVMQRSDKLSSESNAGDKQAPAPTATVEKDRDLAPTTPPGANGAAGSASAVEVPTEITEPDHAPPAPVVQPSRPAKTPRLRPISPPPAEEQAAPRPEKIKTGATIDDTASPDKAVEGELKKPEPATATRAPVRKQESIEATSDSFGAPSTGAQTKLDESTAAGADRSKLVSQLVKQCESAAARGDCAAVRVIAGRIKSEDSTAYSQRVMKNSSITRCLDAAATTVK
jgi:hypothetical protein